MTIIELRNKLNTIIDNGYGNVSVIGERCVEYEDPDVGYNPSYDWRYLSSVEIVDRDGHGGAGLDFQFD